MRDLQHSRSESGGAFIPDGQSGPVAIVDNSDDERPTPMLPILQLYLRDAHGVVTGPPGADLLQVLWCPFGHEPDYVPATSIHWRTAATIHEILRNPPSPAIIEEEDFLPQPCVLHPEPVTEYPPQIQLPKDLETRLAPWSSRDSTPNYQGDLSVAPGWKLGGWAPVSFRDITRIDCPCGSEMRPFLYIDCREWDNGTTSWRPQEEYDPITNPTGTPTHLSNIGVSVHGDGMQIYTCPVSFAHPPAQWNQ
ncbi:hypothetical protein [Kitasatospora sp. NPDC088134]|uniref:hypothetical protein n=1 Tax=Kitasatospora sp. NPDC088134 TaxID=3364071 RepID=UPI00381DFD30